MSRVQLNTRDYGRALPAPTIAAANPWLASNTQAERHVTELAKDLEQAQTQRDAAEARIGNIVQELRTAGASWAVVGHLLGVTKAAAHKRYGRYELTSTSTSTSRHAPAGEGVNQATLTPAGPGRQPDDTSASTSDEQP